MAYELEGRLLEVCTCNVICPCWVGEDPDGGHCEGAMAWHFDRGTIEGVDVSGLTLAGMVYIPGNVLKGGWRAQLYVDEKATPQQQEALINCFSGKLGGPVADMAGLIGEVVGVERVPIAFEIEGGRGTLTIGNAVSAEMTPYTSPSGDPTVLTDSIFSTIQGSPNYVSKATYYKASVPALNIALDIQGRNAVQGHFRFVS
jgi:hypothetical protein